MDIRTLRYFLAAAREGNITRAARTLHISQPSLSRQLAELERELGRPLFLRGKRRVTLTEDGTLLRRRAEDILDLFDRTKHELAGSTEKITGEVAVGGAMTKSLLAAAAALRTEHPGIRFRFFGGDADEVSEKLAAGSLDFAVFLAPADALQYDSLLLPDVSRWGLLLPADAPLAARAAIERADLLRMPLIIHQRKGLHRALSLWAETETLPIAAAYGSMHGSPERFAASGLGALVTTEDLLPAHLPETLVFRPLSPAWEVRYALAWKQYAVHSRAAEAFLAELRKGSVS